MSSIATLRTYRVHVTRLVTDRLAADVDIEAPDAEAAMRLAEECAGALVSDWRFVEEDSAESPVAHDAEEVA